MKCDNVNMKGIWRLELESWSLGLDWSWLIIHYTTLHSLLSLCLWFMVWCGVCSMLYVVEICDN